MGLPSPMDFPYGSDGTIIYLQCRRPRFDPWVGTDPWRRELLPNPVFLTGELYGQRILWVTLHGVSKSWTFFQSILHYLIK